MTSTNTLSLIILLLIILIITLTQPTLSDSSATCTTDSTTTCSSNNNKYDVLVVGGGPAGLQATLTLARAHKSVINIDANEPRNKNEASFHNLIGSDGENIAIFKSKIKNSMMANYAQYVKLVNDTVISIEGNINNFKAKTKSGMEIVAARVILATGVMDDVPTEFQQLYSDSIFICPYCHGHELTRTKWAVLVNHPTLVDYCILHLSWTKNLIAITNGTELDQAATSRLEKVGIKIYNKQIKELVAEQQHSGGHQLLREIIFVDGSRVNVDAIFTKIKHKLPELVKSLQLEVDQHGFVKVGPAPNMATSKPGIYAAGDITTMFHAVSQAIGSGMAAGGFTNMEYTINSAIDKATSATN
jgi:thioredoxin reductase